MPVPQLYLFDQATPGLLEDVMRSVQSAASRLALYATAFFASSGMLGGQTPFAAAQSTYLLGLGQWSHFVAIHGLALHRPCAGA